MQPYGIKIRIAKKKNNEDEKGKFIFVPTLCTLL